MQINEAGLALLKQFEGCKLKAYPDPGTGGEPFTVGYGHTGPGVVPGLVITQERADALLSKDLMKFESGVEEMLQIEPTEGQFSALVCFAYNCGLTNLKNSTLLRMVNDEDFEGAAKQFNRWSRANGRTLPGLVRRRAAEAALFLSA
jgi:lysozyme